MKTSKYKVKLICGYDREQEHTIDANEAHKAYYLFNNPELRGTFNNGLAIRGQDIKMIVPDYQATMGWNPSHKLTGDDYNELHHNGVMQKIQNILATAKEVARIADPAELKKPLVALYKEKYHALTQGSTYAKQLLEGK